MAGRLYKDSRSVLAFARAAGQEVVTVLLLACDGRVEEVADVVAGAGGTVLRRYDPIGYLRAAVPLDSVESVVDSPAVHTASVMHTEDGAVRQPQMPDPGAESPLAEDRGQRLPRLVDPIASPYSALPDLAAQSWRDQHPTWDGRGVTVGIIDGFIDQLLPEFQTATTIDGAPVRKILDNVNPMDPAIDRGPEWITDWRRVTAVDGAFTVDGRRFNAPRDAEYELGHLDERLLYFGRKDLRRDGNPEGSSPLFAVLWDRAAGRVWVDTDQDDDFTDERELADYAERGDIGTFGDPHSATPIRESTMFSVKIRADRDAVAINIGGGAHGTGIAGATFGSRGEHGRYDGIAPGTQIVMMCPCPADARGTPATYLEALIAAMSDPRIDLVVYEWSYYTTVGYLPKDGGSIAAVVAQRLVEVYGKPLFVPASNRGWLNQINEEAAARGVIAVGGYQSQECYRINDGLLVSDSDNLHWASSHGPAGDGGMTPLLLAPSDLLSSQLGYETDRRGPHRLPTGYMIVGGTSTATPAAAAATALLISAAKQLGVPYDTDRLRRALCGSARYLDEVPAHTQGHGLIQVEAAWRLLTELAAVDPERAAGMRLDVEAAVRTAVSANLTTPHRGRGLFEREGWRAGDRRTSVIAVTRTAGPPEPLPVELSWLGNDGTFSCAKTATLPRGEQVEIAVEVAPPAPGVHSAVLVVKDPRDPLAEQRVLATVVVPDVSDLGAVPSVHAEVGYRMAWPGARYIEVPEGAAAIRFEGSDLAVSLPHGGSPLTGEVPEDRTDHGKCDKTWSRPVPGVWEACFIARPAWSERHRLVEEKTRKGNLLVELYGVQLSLAEPPTAPMAGRSQDIVLNLHNRFAGFTGVVRSRPLGTACTGRYQISGRRTRAHHIEVAPGSDLLLVDVRTDTEDADLDVYLYDCTAASPRLVKRQTGDPAGGPLFTENPAPGRWVAVVDAPDVSYEYLELSTNPVHGWLGVAEAAAERPAGARWSTTAHLWFGATAHQVHRQQAALLWVDSDDVQAQSSATKKKASAERVPLGWAALLFSDSGPRWIAGDRHRRCS
ncbi:S8 family serine peptidase [Nonomuraea angiospora]|uniref:Subtilisin family serine protease n=1 Tax=Nonomuraea angiospora TaxID=46172 RepID=A0ABR9LQ76_9ACTN|nr:S8 family serine peptidase [Nonomuraea angiospora]MBE1582767.1 subtilisin family serine protease [Nonomuraea angiospora]